MAWLGATAMPSFLRAMGARTSTGLMGIGAPEMALFFAFAYTPRPSRTRTPSANKERSARPTCAALPKPENSARTNTTSLDSATVRFRREATVAEAVIGVVLLKSTAYPHRVTGVAVQCTSLLCNVQQRVIGVSPSVVQFRSDKNGRAGRFSLLTYFRDKQRPLRSQASACIASIPGRRLSAKPRSSIRCSTMYWCLCLRGFRFL